MVAAPGTPSHGVSWVIAVPRGHRLDKAPQILELNAEKASGFNKTGNWAKFGLQKFLPGTALMSYLRGILVFHILGYGNQKSNNIYVDTHTAHVAIFLKYINAVSS